MKKVIITIVCFTVLYFSLTAAVWVPQPTAGGDNYGPGVIRNTTTNGPQLSWEELNSLATTANIAFSKGHYKAFTDEYGTNYYIKVYVVNNIGVIGVYQYNNSTPYQYLCNPYSTTTDYGRYWAYTPSTDSNTWKPFLVKLEAIRGQLVTTNTYFEQIANAIGTSTSGLLKNISDRTLNTANRLQYSVSGTTYTAAQSLYNIWAQLGSSGTLAGKADSIIDALGPNGSIVGALGVMQNNLTVGLSPGTKVTVNKDDICYLTAYTYDSNSVDYPTITISKRQADNLVSALNNTYMGASCKLLLQDNNLSNTDREFQGANIYGNTIRIRSTSNGSSVNYFYCTPQHYTFIVDPNEKTINNLYDLIDSINIPDYSQTLTDIKNSISNGDIWINNNTALINSMPTVSISYDVGQQIVATLNVEYVGKQIKFLATNGGPYQYTYTTTFSHAFIDNNNRIRLVGLNNSGNSSTFTMVTPNRSVYVIQSNDIVDVLDRIYNWLDNADLATNQTIINIINDDEDAAQNSVTIMSRIRALFRSVYDFNGGIIQTIADFANSTSYFNGLGVD